jgi:hypothetical protein
LTALANFLNYSLNLIVKIGLLELLPAIHVSVWNWLVNRGLWKMVDCDVLLLKEGRVAMFYWQPLRWKHILWQIITECLNTLVRMLRRGILKPRRRLVISLFLWGITLLKFLTLSLLLTIWIRTLFIEVHVSLILATVFYAFYVYLQSSIH